MAKAYLFATNATSQTLNGGGSVDLGNPVHGFGQTCCNKTIDVNGDNITLREGGYYDFDITATVSASDVANVTIVPYVNGTPITGVSSAETIAAANDLAAVAVTFGVLVPRCSTAIVTLVATASAGNPIIVNVSTTAEKVC